MCACDSGKEPVFGKHRMVPLSKGSALRAREYDASLRMFFASVRWTVGKFGRFLTGEKVNLGVISVFPRGRPRSCPASPGECSPHLVPSSTVHFWWFVLHCCRIKIAA